MKVYTWGDGSDYALGHDDETDESTPVCVSGVSSAVSVAAGDTCSVVVTAAGQVLVWGTLGEDVWEVWHCSTVPRRVGSSVL
jgi:alpha-tubulin suppressor-like RCC1 family protein